MNRRHRSLAPMTDAMWAVIDEEAARTLSGLLAGRHLVDFDGPLGWDTAGVVTGRTQTLGNLVPSVSAAARTTRPLLELRCELTLDRTEIGVVERGGRDPDLDPVTAAARQIALAEDTLVFSGNDAAGIAGIASASPHEVLLLDDDATTFARTVSRAVARLRDAGVGGPYGVALGPRCHAEVMETTEHGSYPVLEHLRLVTGGPVVFAPAVDGAVVLSLRGDDFELHVGEDLGVGYVGHDDTTVTLALDESVTLSNHTPEAAIVLRHS